MLKLMYITNDPLVVSVVAKYINSIFIDLETIGKSDRQKGMNTVQSQHAISDIANIRQILPPNVELLVRCNPINSTLQSEIDAIVESGADVIMLPFFETAYQAEKFSSMVGGRVKTCLLIERSRAVINLNEIVAVEGIDEYYVGLNDLHLEYGMKFMFEVLSCGMLDNICNTLRSTDKPFGFGGIARIGLGALPAERVIREHYRLGSTRAIVSRSFCNSSLIKHINDIEAVFSDGIDEIRNLEKEIVSNIGNNEYFAENSKIAISLIKQIVHG